MTDFYALLKQSIVSRRIDDPAQRQAVYAQARAALIRQLTSQQPRPPAAVITARVIEFDRAMRRIEGELQAEIAVDERPRRAVEAEPAEEEPAEEQGYDEPEVEREASGWDVRDRAAEDDEEPIAERQRALPPRRAEPASRAVARRSFTPPAKLAEDDEDLPPPPFRDQWNDEDGALGDDDAAEPAARTARRLPPPQRRLGLTLSERYKVRVLVGAIGALALVRLIFYFVMPGRGAAPASSDVRGGVSDAADRQPDRYRQPRREAELRGVRRPRPDDLPGLAGQSRPFRQRCHRTFARIGNLRPPPGSRSRSVRASPGAGIRAGGSDRADVRRARRPQPPVRLPERRRPSHWQTANLGKDGYARIGLAWVAPQLRTSPNGMDYIIIEPGIPGDGTAADISAIRIDMLGAAPTT